MKKMLSILFMLLIACAAGAQNNQYSVDDRFYEAYKKAVAHLDGDGFHDAIDEALQVADECGDDKAKALAIALEFRHDCHELKGAENEARIQELMGKCLREIQKTGYMQYYYHCWSLYCSFCHNSIGPGSGLHAATQMLNDAVSKNSDYGKFASYKFLARMYTARMDTDHAREYINKALEVYDSSQDQQLKRQSVSELYLFLAQSLEPDTKEFADAVNAADMEVRTTANGVMVSKFKAIMAAVEGRSSDYKSLRTYCLTQEWEYAHERKTPELFQVLDLVLVRDWTGISELYRTVTPLDEFQPVNAYILKNGNQLARNAVLEMQNKQLRSVINTHSSEATAALMDAEVKYGTEQLEADVDAKQARINHLLMSLLLVVVLAFLVLGVAGAIYVKRIRRAMKEAEKANAMKSHFVQNVSHEFRTPLNAILGYSQMLTMPDGMLTEEEKNEFSGYIMSSSNLLLMLINDLLDIGDIEHGNFKIAVTSCRCNEICRNALSAVEYRIPEGVECHFETDVPDDLTIQSDPFRIQQIIINFITNSCKNTESGSIVVRNSISEIPGKLVMSVTDTGCGVPPEKAELIFQRFEKLDENKQGSGIGLNICKMVAGYLGGDIWLDTSYTDGARFCFAVNVPEK